MHIFPKRRLKVLKVRFHAAGGKRKERKKKKLYEVVTALPRLSESKHLVNPAYCLPKN